MVFRCSALHEEDVNAFVLVWVWTLKHYILRYTLNSHSSTSTLAQHSQQLTTKLILGCKIKEKKRRRKEEEKEEEKI